MEAPLTAGPGNKNAFSHWLKNGILFSIVHVVEITLNGSNPINMTAVYAGPRPCLHPKTLVTVDKTGKQVEIEGLKEGDEVLDYNGNIIKIVKNIRFSKSNDFILLKKGSISDLIPSTDILIRKGHHVIYKGKDIDCAKLLAKLGNKKARSIKIDSHVPVWSLATESSTYVMMSGLPVQTWKYSDLVKQSKFGYTEY